jgi:hypothetical protein
MATSNTPTTLAIDRQIAISIGCFRADETRCHRSCLPRDLMGLNP